LTTNQNAVAAVEIKQLLIAFSRLTAGTLRAFWLRKQLLLLAVIPSSGKPSALKYTEMSFH